MHRPRKIYPTLLALAISFGATLTSVKSEIPDPTKPWPENIDIAIALIENPGAPLEEATEAAIFLGEQAEEAEDNPTDDLSHKIIDALRNSLNDNRPEIRDPAASSLASNGDIIALETLEKIHKDGKISDIEFLLYVTLSPTIAGAPFVIDVLNKALLDNNVSADVQRLTLGYLRGPYTSPNKNPDLPLLPLAVVKLLQDTAHPPRSTPASPFPN
jgi:hypothetical protein